MKSNLKYFALLAAFFAFVALPATAAINFNFVGGPGATDEGFLGESGQTEDIAWGLIFDTGSDGFDASYTGLSITNDSIFGGSDDDTFIYGGTTLDNFGGTAFIGDLNGVDPTYESLSFRVIWFEFSLQLNDTAVAGETYGLSDIATSPANPDTVPYDMSPLSANAGAIAFVPEPSTTLLGGLGALLLLRRRRND